MRPFVKKVAVRTFFTNQTLVIPIHRFKDTTHMETFLEILKYTIPALIVFATAYFLLKMLLESHQRATASIAASITRNEATKLTLPLRLQAYERLTLLCDRAAITNVLLRIRVPEMTVAELRGALLLTISQEFDHNTSQQLYVSDTLWQIITVAKEESLALVSRAAAGLDEQADSDLLVGTLFRVLDEQGFPTPLQRAIIAIRTEAGRLF